MIRPDATPSQLLAHHLGCFGPLSYEDRAAIERLSSRVRTLPKGQDLYRDGDRPTDVVVVLSGVLYRHSTSRQGKHQVHSFYIASEAPCLETLHIDYLDHDVGAAADCVIGLISDQEVYALIDQRPNVRAMLWRQTLVQAAIYRQWLLRNSNLSAIAALAHLMCELTTRSRAAGLSDGTRCSLPITQEHLANALGLTSVHMNRTMQALRQTGLAEWRSGELRINDWPALAELGEFDPRYLHLHHCVALETTLHKEPA
jgi:CRP-like cAMP-binding protein